MIIDSIERVYDRAKWVLVFRGLLGIGLGLLIVTRPIASIEAFALVIAIWAFADGLMNIVHAFDLRRIAPHWWVLLLAGVVSVSFGLAAFYYYPTLSLTFAVVWTALWLITAGVLGVLLAVRERSAEISWGWTLIFSLLALAAGVLAVAYPGITVVTLMTLLATFGIVGGVALLAGAGKIQSVEHQLHRAFADGKQFTATPRGTR